MKTRKTQMCIRDSLCHSECQVICLRTGTHEHYLVYLVRHHLQQILTVINDPLMQITCVGI